MKEKKEKNPTGGAAGGKAAAAGEGSGNGAAPTAIRSFFRSRGAKLLVGALVLLLLGGGIWAGSRLLKDRRTSPADSTAGTSEVSVTPTNIPTEDPVIPTNITTDAPVIPTQPAGPGEETRPSLPEPVENACGAEGGNLT